MKFVVSLIFNIQINMIKTIVALSTPAGVSGLAVVRLSGPEAFEITGKIFKGAVKLTEAPANTIWFGKIISPGTGDVIDEATVSIFRAPRSYTGENVVEITCHGGYVVSSEIIAETLKQGAFPAEPGEFTRRAFLNGKLDLVKAEAIADLIHSISEPSAQASTRQSLGAFTNKIKNYRSDLVRIAALLELELDFSDEDVEFVDRAQLIALIEDAISFSDNISDAYKAAEIYRNGYRVCIAGYPNSGKSTLFNAIIGSKRAIVSKIPGTTRDYLEEFTYIRSLPFKIFDTAGLRKATDVIEIEGIRMVRSMLAQANAIVLVNDASLGFGRSDSLREKIGKLYPEAEIILVQNKADRLKDGSPEGVENLVSARKGFGVSEIKEMLFTLSAKSGASAKEYLLNARQFGLLNEAKQNLVSARFALLNSRENEVIAIDVRAAISKLDEITGDNVNSDVLESIFSKYCIGK